MKMKFCYAVLALITGVSSSGCSLCGPEQHAVTTFSPGLTVGGDVPPRQFPFNWHLTQPPASEATMDFLVSALEGSTNGEGLALAFMGTDPITAEVINLVVALPVTMRSGDEFAVGSTFSIEPGGDEAAFWGSHDLAQSNKADVAFVAANYSFPPPVFTPTYRAVSSTGTIHVNDRSNGRIQLQLNLAFADAAGKRRTVEGYTDVTVETSAATCS